MKKVLLVSYRCPPVTCAGSLRVAKMIKYLPEFGWEPYVLGGGSEEDSNPYIFKPKYFDLFQFGKRVRDTIRSYLRRSDYYNKEDMNIEDIIGKYNSPKGLWPLSEVRMPDKYMFWIWPAIRLGKKLLKREKFDLIYSSSGPPSSVIVASILQRYARLPWVAEFRDLWSDNHVDRRREFINKIDSYLENKFLQNCSTLVTVSGPLKDQLLNRHRKNTYVVYNGYDKDDYPIKVNLTRKLTITYTGRIYPGKQDPKPLFEAITNLSKKGQINPDFLEISFYGTEQEIIKTLAKRYGIERYVFWGGLIPHEQALIKQKESWLLLLLEWNDPSAKGVLTSKLFEYLGAKRPILSIGYEEGSIRKIITETGIGVVLNNPKDIENFLLLCIERYIKSDRFLGFIPNEEALASYSRRKAAEKLSRIFFSLI